MLVTRFGRSGRFNSIAFLRKLGLRRSWLRRSRLLRGQSRARVAAALAVGVFIANLPIYPLQTAAALLAAWRLRLHPLAVVAGSQISTPPVNLGLIGAGIAVGHVVLHREWRGLASVTMAQLRWHSIVGSLLADWAVGGVIVGAILAVAIFAVSMGVFRLMPERTR